MRKDRQKYMDNMKQSILNKATKGGSRDNSKASSDATHTTSSATTSAAVFITRSNDVYIYGVGVVAMLAIAACVFFAYNKKPQASNKDQAKEQQRPIKPRTPHSML